MNEPTLAQWNAFVRECLDTSDSGSNMKMDYDKVHKKHKVAYFSYLRAAWESVEKQGPEEFRKINGNVPESFFTKYIDI